MLKSFPFRKFKVRAKLFLDFFRPYFRLTGMSPWPRWTAETFGTIIHPESIVSGNLHMWEPAWVQMNRGAECRNVKVPGEHFLFLGEGAVLENRNVINHTLVFRDRIIVGEEEISPMPTLSVDLEGNTAVCPGDSPESIAVQKEAAIIADRIHHLFQEFNLQSTWYVVGSLFDDPFMKPLCGRLIQDPDVDVGWHTQDHMNYFTADEAEVEKDMARAQRIRETYGIPLDAMAFPYNAVGHMETVLNNGFSKLRGYIGQYNLPFTVRFDGFTFLGSSLFLGPLTLQSSFRFLKRNKGACNIFMHPVDWIGYDLSMLKPFIECYSYLTTIKKKVS